MRSLQPQQRTQQFHACAHAWVLWPVQQRARRNLQPQQRTTRRNLQTQHFYARDHARDHARARDRAVALDPAREPLPAKYAAAW